MKLLVVGLLWLASSPAPVSPAVTVPAVSATQLSASDEARALQLGKQLRCPVCQGMPIAESPANMAQDMMHLVREKVAAGDSSESINAYFTARYGAWVLLSPPTQGVNILVWLLPPLALLSGALWVLLYLRRGALPPPPGSAAQASSATASSTAAAAYIAAIRREVER